MKKIIQEKTNNYSIISILLLIILCLLTAYNVLTISKINNKIQEIDSRLTKVENNNKLYEEVIETKPESNEEDVSIKKVLFDTTSRQNDSIQIIELTTDGRVLVTLKDEDDNSNNIDRKEVANNIVDTYEVQVGMSDICWGDTRIIFVNQKGTASYIDIDQLVCGKRLVVNELKNINNIKSFKDETIKHPNEPDEHVVYVITKDGKKTNITDKLE